MLGQLAETREAADGLSSARRYLAHCLKKLPQPAGAAEAVLFGSESIKLIAAQLGISPALTMRFSAFARRSSAV